ncbi:MAG: hypothetical protein AB2556_25430, partial [Candidatus Thiodiazotropha sp.]
MLDYAHINLLSMLQRFQSDDVVRVATDGSIGSMGSSLTLLPGFATAEQYWTPSFSRKPRPSGGKRAKSSICPKSMRPTSSRHALSYLNGGGCRGKTTRAI